MDFKVDSGENDRSCPFYNLMRSFSKLILGILGLDFQM